MYALMLALKSRPQDSGPVDPGAVPSAIVTISKACQDAAWQMYHIIVDEWTKGSVPVHGYSHAQFLFCATLILSASSLLPFGNKTDFTAIETAMEIFRSLKTRGNLAATGLGECIERIHQCVLSRIATGPFRSNPEVGAASLPLATDSISFGIHQLEDGTSLSVVPEINSPTFLDMATEISLSETDTREFLAQSGLNVGSMSHAYIGDVDFPFLYPHFSSVL